MDYIRFKKECSSIDAFWTDFRLLVAVCSQRKMTLPVVAGRVYLDQMLFEEKKLGTKNIVTLFL